MGTSVTTLWRAAGFTAILNIALLVATLVTLFTFGDDDDRSASPVGWVAVMGAVWTFGSFGILFKHPTVAAAHPQVFQIYFNAGVSLTSILVLTFTDFVFSFWGLLGAAIWMASMLCANVGIQGLGYGTATATWASITMAVAFVWGTAGFGEKPSSTLGAVIAILVLAIGVTGVAAAQSPSLQPPPVPAAVVEGQESSPTSVGVENGNLPLIGSVNAGDDDAEEKLLPTPSSFSASAGWCAAVGCGLCNGSLMVPFHYFTEANDTGDSGIAYVACFALGVVVLTPVNFILFFRVPFEPCPSLQFRELSMAGLVTGCFWAIGNVCSTYATYFLGQAVGYPLTQTCIVVAGLWGAFFFGELRGCKALSLFAVSVAAIIGGAALLGACG